MTAKRRFEHVSATSSKFWEIWRDGSMVYVQFGKLGADGQLKVKAEKTAEAAERSVEKQIREKLAKGYAEAAAAPPAPPAPRLAPKELERHLASLPPLGEDDAAYLVFADWLQAQGHPWGELITLQHGARTAPNAKKRDQLERAAGKLLAQHRATILGAAAEHEQSSFEWYLGFVRTATLGTAADPAAISDALDALLARPAASRLEGLVLNPVPAQFETHRDWDSSPDNVVDPWTELDELARRVPPRVTHLGFGGWPAPAASAYVQMPSYSALSKPFKRLRRLELTGWPNPKPGKLALPELRDLEVRFGMASGRDLAAITNGKLGKLERISVWLGGRAYCILDDVYPPDEDSDADDRYPSHFSGGDLELLDVHGVSSAARAPDVSAFIDALPRTIKHLGIRSATLDDEMCRAILSRKLIGSLETLDLSGGTLDDDSAKLLLTTSAKKSLSRLKTLDLERNCLGAATAKKLAAAFPSARIRHQRKTGQPELFLRYVAVME
jgi:uncharacterized protein (TIGR02996 family)